MMERSGYALPDPNTTKGGGLKGGPKRWTGGGPAPARHIPWPELFRHHLSLCEGHLKMMDMVRKHCVESSGNHRMIMGILEHTKVMLQDTKHVSRVFVPPKNSREQVPLGSSSVSMYPGYSPADHEYGKAAEEFGRYASEARLKGEEVKHPEAEYEIGQAKGLKRRTLAAIREAKAKKEGGSGSGSGSGNDGNARLPSKKPETTNGESMTTKPEEAPSNGDKPGFFIDTKPTPVNLPGISHAPGKREASPPPEPVEGKKHKKAKTKHDGEMPSATEGVEFENIDEEREARLKEKEEKRKRKEEKKRKRESAGEPIPSATNPPAPESASVEKPKKKKSKHVEEEKLADRTASKKRSSADEGGMEDGEGKKKKKRKKDKDAPSDV